MELQRDCEALNAINTDVFLEVIKLVLGEKVWEEKGKGIGVSVKSVGPEGVHMEETFASEVKGLGRFPSGRNMGTMNIAARPDGFISGTAQGIFTAQDGDSVVWKCLCVRQARSRERQERLYHTVHDYFSEALLDEQPPYCL